MRTPARNHADASGDDDDDDDDEEDAQAESSEGEDSEGGGRRGGSAAVKAPKDGDAIQVFIEEAPSVAEERGAWRPASARRGRRERG